MRILLALYLTLVQLTPTAVWEECAKIEQLREHYRLHRLTEPALTFVDFLRIHYQDTTQHQQQHDHSEIPFSHSSQSATVHCFQFIVNSFDWAANQCNWFSEASLRQTFRYKLSFTPSVFLSIWHPPKI